MAFTSRSFTRLAPVAALALSGAVLAACAQEPARPAPVAQPAPVMQPAPAPAPAPAPVPRARG